MEGMNMGSSGSMDMTSSPSPSLSPDVASPSMSSDSGMTDSHMSMQMFFYAADSVTLWLKPWQTDSSGSYAGEIWLVVVPSSCSDYCLSGRCMLHC